MSRFGRTCRWSQFRRVVWKSTAGLGKTEIAAKASGLSYIALYGVPALYILISPTGIARLRLVPWK